MAVKKKKYYLFIIVSFLVLIVLICVVIYNNSIKEVQEPVSDLNQVKERGVLNVAVDYNSINYFVYRGKPMGYQYELIQAVSKELDVNSNFVVIKDLNESVEGLNKGDFDIIATNITVSRELQKHLAFTTPLKQTRQVVVQRKPHRSIPDSMFLKDPEQLAHKTIHVNPKYSYNRRLTQISEESGIEIRVVNDTVHDVEQLVAMVSRGEIDYTVCDENVAILYRSYYPNLDVSLKISYPQNIAWGLRKESVELKTFLDQWIKDFTQTREYRNIYHSYFESPRIASRFFSEYHTVSGGKISAYDDLVKKLSAKYKWDWRLISSIIFHESRFEPEVESWGGAIGLMQLMPTTAESFGVQDLKDPYQNVEGGLLLLNWLDKQLTDAVPDSTERIKFILAAYNIGLAPVLKARKLAEETGKASDVWENVGFFVKNEVSHISGRDSASIQVYARGEEAVNFVDRVLHNHQHYLNIIPD